MKYVIGYVGGYSEHGRSYVTIVEAETQEAAIAKLLEEKKAEPFAFDWVEVQTVETVEQYHKGQ